MIIEKNVWIVQPIPHGTNRMKQFLEDNFIAIGYPAGRSFEKMSSDDLKNVLHQMGWSEGIGNVNLFVNAMNIGDFVVVPDDNKKDVYLGELSSDYSYDPNVDEPNDGFYPHQREVKWYFDKKPLLRHDLPEAIRGSLRYPGTIASITKHRSIIENLILSEDVQKNEKIITQAMNVLADLLDDHNPEIRLKAAEVILNYYSPQK